MAIVTFLLLTAALISLWFKREPLIWGPLLALSVITGLFAGLLSVLGVAWASLLALFWVSYREKPTAAWFLAIAALSLMLKIRFLPGFSPLCITSKFGLGVEGILIGLFPLAFVVPLSKNLAEWQGVARGAFAGALGIGAMAILATLTHTVAIDCKLPSAMALRTFSNLFFTSIPEEGFYRGFLQNNLCRTFGNRAAGLLLTSVIFTAAHIFWTPDLSVLAFVFIAGLLYGGVYLWSGRIEAAIATHFLLNLIHQSCFTYHAM